MSAVVELPTAAADSGQPPHDVAAEQAVLGAMLLSRNAIADVIDRVGRDDFYQPRHQIVYDAIIGLYRRDDDVDPVTVKAELERRKQLRRAGGATYLHTLTQAVPSPASAGYYARIVTEKTVLRRAVATGTRITELAYADVDVADVVSLAQAEIQGLVDSHKPADPKLTSWEPVDLTEVLTGTWTPLNPTVGLRSDGIGLFYPGKMHSVASESGAGKTWLILAVAFQELQSGNTVTFIDFEDDEGGVVGRLLTMGADKDWIRDRFKYLRPNEPLTAGPALESLNRNLALRPSLVVIDGVTEAMVMHGLNPLDNRDVAVFIGTLPRLVAASGAATVCLDHVPKDEESRGRYAIGGVHKLNAIDGAAYVLENREPIGINLTGRTAVLVSKDRPGQLLKHAQPRRKDGLHPFAELIITSHDDTYAEFEITAAVPRATGFRPTVLMTRISDALEKHGPLSQRSLITTVGGKRDYIIEALRLLIDEKYVSVKTPHELLKPFAEDEEGDE